MSLRRIRAVAWKESLHVFRDPRSLAMAIAMPMVLLLIFGYALTLDVDQVPLAVWDRSGTPASRDLVSRFAGSRYFSIRAAAANYAEIERAIDAREVLAALVIPADFARELRAGRPAAIQFLVDGGDANTAAIALGYAEALAEIHSAGVVLETVRRSGGSLRNPVDLRPRVWFNPDRESRNFIIPGLTAVILMVIAALLTSLTVAREWERGTMEQLISTPVKGPELILGKLVPYFAVGMLDVALAVLMGEFLFHVPLRGSLALLFSMAAVFLIGTQSMGILISVVARGQLVASQLAMVLTFLPSFLLSGFMYAIDNMPEAVQVVTYAVPARYFIALLRGIYLKGAGLPVLAREAAFLTLFAAAMLALAILRFRKKLRAT